jgi:hypothetical protein
MTQFIGRRLAPDESVRFVDGDTSNFSIENLEIYKRPAVTRDQVETAVREQWLVTGTAPTAPVIAARLGIGWLKMRRVIGARWPDFIRELRIQIEGPDRAHEAQDAETPLDIRVSSNDGHVWSFCPIHRARVPYEHHEMAKRIGRPLEVSETVQMVDGDTLNFTQENLRLITKKDVVVWMTTAARARGGVPRLNEVAKDMCITPDCLRGLFSGGWKKARHMIANVVSATKHETPAMVVTSAMVERPMAPPASRP